MRRNNSDTGMVPITRLGARKLASGSGSYHISTSSSTSGRAIKSTIVLAASWTASGSQFYADVTHDLSSAVYIVQAYDNLTGDDILFERINRTLDIDKCRLFLSYTPTSITVLIG